MEITHPTYPQKRDQVEALHVQKQVTIILVKDKGGMIAKKAQLQRVMGMVNEHSISRVEKVVSQWAHCSI